MVIHTKDYNIKLILKQNT